MRNDAGSLPIEINESESGPIGVTIYRDNTQGIRVRLTLWRKDAPTIYVVLPPKVTAMIARQRKALARKERRWVTEEIP
jgi:hypothetical protein